MKQSTKTVDYCIHYYSPIMEVLSVCTDSIIAESFGEKSGDWTSLPGESGFFPEN